MLLGIRSVNSGVILVPQRRARPAIAGPQIRKGLHRFIDVRPPHHRRAGHILLAQVEVPFRSMEVGLQAQVAHARTQASAVQEQQVRRVKEQALAVRDHQVHHAQVQASAVRVLQRRGRARQHRVPAHQVVRMTMISVVVAVVAAAGVGRRNGRSGAAKISIGVW